MGELTHDGGGAALARRPRAARPAPAAAAGALGRRRRRRGRRPRDPHPDRPRGAGDRSRRRVRPCRRGAKRPRPGAPAPRRALSLVGAADRRRSGARGRGGHGGGRRPHPRRSASRLRWPSPGGCTRPTPPRASRSARHGAALFPGGPVALLTHCNAGALATGGIGTALGIVRALHAEGRLVAPVRVRGAPGAAGRAPDGVGGGAVTAIPVTLLADSARAPRCWRAGRWTGSWSGPTASPPTARWPTRSGPTRLALAAARHRVPFVVAAPTTTFDLACPSGRGDPDRAARRRRGAAGAAHARRARPASTSTTRRSTSRRPSW